MTKKLLFVFCFTLALCFMLTSISYAAEKQTGAQKARTFWQRLFNYPAKVTDESVKVVAETGKRGTEVTTKEVKRVGQVTSGEFGKTKELITEPLTGTAETVTQAVEETVKIPVESAKEEPAPSTTE